MIQTDLAAQTPLMKKCLRTAERLETRLKGLGQRTERVRTRVNSHQSMRLIAGALFCIGLVVAAIKPELRIGFPITAAFFLIFSVLVVRTRNLSRHLERLEKLAIFLRRQELRSRGQASGRDCESAEKAARALSEFHFSRDLGLFGSHSFWTLIDETLTEEGERNLLRRIADPPSSAAEIRAMQDTIRGLRPERWFYTRLCIIADRQEFRISSHQILELIKTPLADSSFRSAYALAIALWFASIGALIYRLTHGGGPLGFVLLAFSLVHLGFIMKGGSAFKKGIGLSHHLELLEPIFAAIEERTKHSARLRQICPSTHDEGPSRQVRRLGRVLTLLGVETNPLLHFLLNAFFPWSSTATLALERVRKKIASSFPSALRELANLEVLGTYVIFDHYQTSVYPEIRNPNETLEPVTLQLRQAFHPLIDRTKVVANDFRFPQGKQLGLLTGSNMSGKSTFLRTVGINQMLANMGLPTFAENFVTRPLSVESCIEVSDSLRDGFSYFYSEVRRIKHVIQEAQRGKGVLFLIDEIFRGTNNRERQIGSRAVIRTLARAPGAQGFISTHDLELASLESTEAALINLHFREEIRGRDMVFPYLLHHGPCPTTNALRIMEMEGIDLGPDGVRESGPEAI